MGNMISVQITPEDKTTVLTAIDTIQATLAKYIVALTPDQKRELAKVSDKTLPFIEKVKEYIGSNPEFVPPFMDITEFDKDYQAYKDLIEILHGVRKIDTNLADTVALTGSETYQGCLTYYNSIKQAVKSGIANAKAIYEELSKRFKVTSSHSTGSEETTTT